MAALVMLASLFALASAWRVPTALAADGAVGGLAVAGSALTTGVPDLGGPRAGDDAVRLGMELRAVDNELMEGKNLLSDFGLYVVSVVGGGPADRAGIVAGDVVGKADGLDVVNIDDLDWALESVKGGGSVLLEVESRRSIRVVEVELEDLASDHPGQAERVSRMLSSRGVRASHAVYRQVGGSPAGDGASGGRAAGEALAGGAAASGGAVADASDVSADERQPAPDARAAGDAAAVDGGVGRGAPAAGGASGDGAGRGDGVPVAAVAVAALAVVVVSAWVTYALRRRGRC